jgi:NosR/NirI family transcriptional regulator, nitrous oxide reductase regulator
MRGARAGGKTAGILARRWQRIFPICRRSKTSFGFRVLKSLLVTFCAAAFHGTSASAGTLDRDGVAKHFPDPYVVGERDTALPIWPLFRHNFPQVDVHAGYVYESIDLAPLPGFSGTPPNLLIAITPEGTLMGVTILSHHEPVFLEGLGEEPLYRFVEQYRGLTMKQNVKIGSGAATSTGIGTGTKQNSSSAVIDGVSRATASVRIINETILSASLQVARAKFGLAPGRDPALAPRLKPDDGQTLTAEALTAKSYLLESTLKTADVDKAFADSGASDIDGGPLVDPQATSTTVWIAYLSVPQIGRAILGHDGFARLQREVPDGDHAILVAARGRYGFQGPAFVPGAVPDQLSLTQDGLPLDMRDMAFMAAPATPALPKDVPWSILKVIAGSGLDPARPFQVALRITREKGQLYPERLSKDFPVTYALPADYFIIPVPELTGWRAVWRDQWRQLAFTLAALVVLCVALSMPKRLAKHVQAFNVFRAGFLACTLVGIGWWGQGQLSILNVVGLINAATNTGDVRFLLFDPVSLLLWSFVLGSLVIWGRGTFCGWLCPFGALQEFASLAAKRLGVPQVRMPYAIDRVLRLTKYAVLAAIIGAAFVSTSLAEHMAEFEPFKTAITLGFDRAWPFVLYAVAMVALSTFVFKGFCLYLCPLGAALALLGRARQFDWIPRRAECGSPCQLCTVRCSYGAIEPKGGAVRYDECFQCMDCVVIYHDPTTCVPEVLARKGRSLPLTRPSSLPANITTGREAVT